MAVVQQAGQVDEPFDEVLEAARSGSERAASALYRALQPRVLRFLRAQEPSLAEDLAAETWLAVAAGLHRFRGDEDAFRSWIFTIAYRRMIEVRRKRSRQRTDTAPADSMPEVPAAENVEGSALANVSADAAVARLVSALSSDQAQVILLRVLADMDVNQVADVLGKRPGAVRALQQRALRRLARDPVLAGDVGPAGATVRVVAGDA